MKPAYLDQCKYMLLDLFDISRGLLYSEITNWSLWWTRLEYILTYALYTIYSFNYIKRLVGMTTWRFLTKWDVVLEIRNKKILNVPWFINGMWTLILNDSRVNSRVSNINKNRYLSSEQTRQDFVQYRVLNILYQIIPNWKWRWMYWSCLNIA